MPLINNIGTFNSPGTPPRQSRRSALFDQLSDLLASDEQPRKDLTKKSIKIIDDPDPDALVETVTGKKHKISECIYVGSLWYHKSSPDVFTDCLDGKLHHRKNAMDVITKLEINNDKKLSVNIERGQTYYNNQYKLIPISSCKYSFDGSVLSLDVIKGWEYAECFTKGLYTDKDAVENNIDKIKIYQAYRNNFINKDLTIPEKIKIGLLSPSYTITEGLKYTFGIELECSRGYVPTWLAFQKYNMLCVRDGSVSGGADNGGPEYVTGIMTGDTGFAHLQEICLEISKRCKVNTSCGVHVHLGNINFDKCFLINSYRLALFLEKEMFSTLPYSRRKNRYCRQLKPFSFNKAIQGNDLIRIEEDYNKLFKYVSVEKVSNPNFEYNKSKQHPLGAKCGYDHSTPRYCWLNYVPAMFNTRNNNSFSLELRNHSGTTNFTKVKNWTLFFMAFCAFAEQYPNEIEPGITISQILERIFPKKAKSLILYFNTRKEKFSGESEDADLTTEDKKSMKELITN